MTEYWSGSITFTGLGSGTDFGSVIEATMKLEGYRLDRMEVWESMWTSKLEQVEKISTLLAEYETQLASMDTIGEFMVKSASSTSSLVGVSAGSNAMEGSHTIEVEQVATTDVWTTSYGWENTSTEITASDSTFSLTYGDTAYSIDVDGGTTLAGLVSLINNDSDLGDCVRASLIDDGNEIHLQLRGLDLGAANCITLSSSGMEGLDSTDFEHTQAAQNAKIKVDGYPSEADEWIERDTNTINDVVDGLTFTLYGSTEGSTAAITVKTDIEAIIKNIEAFVQYTNTLRDAISALDEDQKYYDDDGEEIDTTGYLVRGNYGMDILEQTLQDILASKGLGFMYYDNDTETGDIYSSLSTLGISTNTKEDSGTCGQLVINYEELLDALEDDPDAVALIFAGDNDGISYSSNLGYVSSVDGLTEAGEHEVEYTVQNGALVSATIDGTEAVVSGWQITGAYESPAAALTVNVLDHSDGAYTGTVCIRQGKINQTLDALDTLTDPEKGILVIIEDSYKSIIKSNGKAIEREEARLARKEATLIEKYARLEALLGEYEDISAGLESSLSELE